MLLQAICACYYCCLNAGDAHTVVLTNPHRSVSRDASAFKLAYDFVNALSISNDDHCF
jgi:hypothetical protein